MNYGNYVHGRRSLGGAEHIVDIDADGSARCDRGTYEVLHSLARLLSGDENYEEGIKVIKEALTCHRIAIDCVKQVLLEVQHEFATRKADGTLHEIQNPLNGKTFFQYLNGMLREGSTIITNAARDSTRAVHGPIFDKIAALILAHTGKDMAEKRAMERRAVTMGEGDRQRAGLVWEAETGDSEEETKELSWT